MPFTWTHTPDIDVLNKRTFSSSSNSFIIISKKITFLSVYVEEPTKSIYFEIDNHIDVSLIQLYYFIYELSVKLFYSNLLI